MLIKISSSDNFINLITKTTKDNKSVLKWFESTHEEIKVDFDFLEIIGHTFSSFFFRDCTFNKVTFNNCVFGNSTFKNCNFSSCVFENSKILESQIEECTFIGCNIFDSKIADCTIDKTIISYSREFLGFQISNSILDCLFQNINFQSFEFSNIIKTKGKKLFSKCSLVNGVFKNSDLTKSSFVNCELALVSFSRCLLSSNTINITNNNSHKFSSIDFITIRNSEVINSKVLKGIFEITEPDIKTFVEGLTQEIIFQTVFISYSFKDKAFASLLNGKLRTKGVNTFLWQENAPGGKYLTKIMSENIQKHDRLLFIASKDSIKSKACHFELTKGREKYEKTWEIVLFPIHIDNYLFEIEKVDIPPKNREDYWENIQELKRINSIDFSEFNVDRDLTDEEHIKFEKKVADLIRTLRKR